MSWEEVRARLAQEAYKRFDLTLHRIGVGPSPVEQNRSPSRKSEFIFSTAEIAERVGVSQMHVSRLIRRALERLRTVADHAG